MTSLLTLIPATTRILWPASRNCSRVFGLVGAAASLCFFSSCSLASLDEEGNTDTVPLVIDSDSAVGDDDAEGGEEAVADTASSQAITEILANSAGGKVGDTSAGGAATGGTSSRTNLISHRPKSNSLADAWGSPGIFVADSVFDKDPATPNPSEDTVAIPPPNSAASGKADPPTVLSLKEYREKVYAVQQKEEAKRFREAVGIVPGEGETSGGTASSDSPEADDRSKTKAAYQIFRWNLMETLAGAERAYWRLHFAERQSEVVEKSVNTLAEINDKARIGLLRKTRDASDIAATETMRAHRKVAAAEADALRTAAMVEAASFLGGGEEPASPSAPMAEIRTETPPSSSPPPAGISMAGRAQKSHPLYLSDRLRVDGTPEAAKEVKLLDSSLDEKVEKSLERVRTAFTKREKAESEAATFSAGIDENLRNFSAGKISLEAVSTFEKGLLSARQAHITAQEEFQDALIDFELEVGDFLESRNQETPLSTLIAK